LENAGYMIKMDKTGSKQESSEGFCEQGDEPCCSIKAGNFSRKSL
jgi:hypothetical protein